MKIKSIKKISYQTPQPVYDVIDVKPHHNFIAYDKGPVIFHNCAFIDEVNFAKSGVKDINKAKLSMKALYDTINARISGTFRIGGQVYGKMVTASSKNTDSDFLSDHIQKQLDAGNTSLYLVDEPQWEILPKEMFSDEKFYFTVGDRYKRGFVIPKEHEDEKHFKEYEEQGYKIIAAPAELRKNFLADYDISLRDIAGISVAGSMGFISQELITPNISQDRVNPFYTDVIHVGTKDSSTIEEYFHLEAVSQYLKSKQMNIHLDLSETGDRTGISGVVVDGNKIVENFEGKKIAMPYFKQIFQIGIECPRGDRLSFQKVVNFLIWLRSNHFNVGVISTDQYQSSYLREVLTQKGFETKKISVDASMDPYIGLRNALNDQRVELIKHQLQEDELVNLQRINNKIDHPATGTTGPAGDGSKDCSDALCGALWTLTESTPLDRPEPKKMGNVFAAVNGSRTSPMGRSSANLGYRQSGLIMPTRR